MPCCAGWHGPPEMAFEVKICGIRDAATLALAAAGGADYVGFVFYPPSPRSLDLAAAALAGGACRSMSARSACWSTPTTASSTACWPHVSLDILQLHGAETPERVAAIAADGPAAGS